jgi:ABC-type uncharacterized transport system involved in gliding motility auxiliary subunit
MSHWTFLIGALGALSAVGGLIAYSLDPGLLWLVSLLEGLGLMCLTIFFVFHFEALKAFSARRSTRLGVNSVLMVVLFAGLVVIANFLASRHSTRWDLSETQHFSLAPQTHRVLRGLNREVKVTVFTQERAPGFSAYRDLLDSYKQGNPNIKVEFVDPERRPAIARQYGITRMDTAVFESGNQSTRVAAASEAELTGALIRVSKDTKKRILFLEGHGERAITDKERGGLSTAREGLEKQGYDVGTLSLLKDQAVPETTSLLVLAGPRRPVTKEEKDRLDKFVAGGGRLLVLLDPDTEADLDDLLAHWGLEAGRGVLVDVQDRLAQGDPTALLVRTFTEHEITQDFTFAVLFPLARHVSFHAEKGGDWDFVPLARTSARSWAETDPNRKVMQYDEKQDVQGPLPIAAALTPKKQPAEGQRRAAIVLVGNSSFTSNAYVNFPGNTDFLLHAIGWLAEERELISITPKEPAFRPFIPNPTQERLLLYVQVLLLPTLTFVWGLTIWRRRRRL